MHLIKLSNKSINQILQLERSKKKFNINNLKKFLNKIGNPQNNLNIIHVAGTNGKGSTSAMISSVLQQAGYKVGLFTSPHINKINERIKINNKNISNSELDSLTNKVLFLRKKYNISLSFFETVTVLVFFHFVEKNVDYAILEVGMGGRLDATNIIPTAALSIITNIGLDHQEVLGDTISKIAKEKAGIIKENSLVVTGAKGKALRIIKQKCKQTNSELIKAKKSKLKTNLNGSYQQENVAIAHTALNQLDIPEKHIKAGLKKVIWPARFEKRSNLLIDAAHNLDGFKALVKSLKQIKYQNLVIVLGLMQDKDSKKILKIFKPLKPIIILTKPSVERAKSPDEIAKYLKEYIIIENPKQAIKYAKSITKKQDLILITGSIYLIGEIYSFFNHQTPR